MSGAGPAGQVPAGEASSDEPSNGGPPTGRLAACFDRLRAEGRGGLSIYWPVGYPDRQQSEAVLRAAIDGGADWIEVGLPWSDPAADGPVIQEATAQAIRGGVRVQDTLDVAARLRGDHPEIPLVAMTYANIAYQMGWDQFAKRLREVGFDGAILADVPLEESAPVRTALSAEGLAWVPLVTPTTSPERMQQIGATATGFLYVVSNVGITGQGDPGPLVEKTTERAKAAGCPVPLVVGFGISTADDVARVLAAGADGAIVGSHVVAIVRGGGGPDDVQAAVSALKEGTRR